jgi:hypothetical protein
LARWQQEVSVQQLARRQQARISDSARWQQEVSGPTTTRSVFGLFRNQ